MRLESSASEWSNMIDETRTYTGQYADLNVGEDLGLVTRIVCYGKEFPDWGW